MCVWFQISLTLGYTYLISEKKSQENNKKKGKKKNNGEARNKTAFPVVCCSLYDWVFEYCSSHS